MTEPLTITLGLPPRWKRSKARLVRACIIAGVVFLIGAAPSVALVLTTDDGPSVTVIFALVALAVGFIIVANELQWDREPATITLTKEFLSVQRGTSAPTRWAVPDIAAVRATDRELQVELKSGEVYRTLTGRSPDELRRTAEQIQAAR
ncbi:MAG: hypothetical protein JO332_06475 [Planctomycetaceae bacterium]|nr:hypothetical protein [Planctomycetaceae bacterium]